MNQKTKELVKELSDKTWTIIADEEIALGEAYEAREHRERREEIFAELIVRECVEVADHSNVTGKSIIGQRIKQHFGVEE